MKPIRRRRTKPITLGELIVCVYDARGPRAAPGMVSLAMKVNLIGFAGHQRFVVP
jgi:hypothetical protein